MNSRSMMNGCTQAPGGSGSGGPNGMYMNGMQPYMYDPNGMDQSQMSMPFTHYGGMMGGSGLASMDGSGYGHPFFGSMAQQQQQQQQQQMLQQQLHHNMASSVYGGMGGSFSMPGTDQMSMANHYQSGAGMGHYLNGGSGSYAHYPQQQQQQQQQIPPNVRPASVPQANPQEIADSIYHMASFNYRAPVQSPLAPPGSRPTQHQAQPTTQPQQSQQSQQSQAQSQQPLQPTAHHQQAHSMPLSPMTPLGASAASHTASNGGAPVAGMVSMPGCYSPGPPYSRTSGMLSPAMQGATQPSRTGGAPGSSSSSSSHPSPTTAGGTSGPMSPLSIRSPPLSAVPSSHSAGGGGGTGNLAGQLSPGSVQSASSPGLTPPPHVLAQSHSHRSSPGTPHLLALHGASPSSSAGMAAVAGSMYGQGVSRPQHAAMPRLHAQPMGTPGQMTGSDGGTMVSGGGMFGNPLQSLERLAQITDKYPVDPKSIVSGSAMHDTMSLYHQQSPISLQQQQLAAHFQSQQQPSNAHSYAMYGMQQQQAGAGSPYQSVGSGYATTMPPHLHPAGDYAKLETAERAKAGSSQSKKNGSSKAASHSASSSGSKGKSTGTSKKLGAAGKTVQSPQAGDDGVSRKGAEESGSSEGRGIAGQPPSGGGSGSNTFPPLPPSPLGAASSTAADGGAQTSHVIADPAIVEGAATADATTTIVANNKGSPAECTLQGLLTVPPGRSPSHYQLHPPKKPKGVGSAAGLLLSSPSTPVAAGDAADDLQPCSSAGSSGVGAAAVHPLPPSRDKEPQRIRSPTRPPQSPATTDVASTACTASSGSSSSSSADSVGSGVREDRFALESEADVVPLSHVACGTTDSPAVPADTNGYHKCTGGSSAKGGESYGGDDVDAANFRDSELAGTRDSFDHAKQQQLQRLEQSRSATAKSEEQHHGSAAPQDLTAKAGTSDALMTAAKDRSAKLSTLPSPFFVDDNGSSAAVPSNLRSPGTSAFSVGAGATAVVSGLSAARGSQLTSNFGASSGSIATAAAAAVVSASVAGIDYSNSKNVPLRKRKPGLPPADATRASTAPAPSQVLLPPPSLIRDTTAPVAKKPRSFSLKKPHSFSIVAGVPAGPPSEDGSCGGGAGRSAVTLSPSVLAAAAAARRMPPERGVEPPPPHLEKAVTTPVKAEDSERKDSLSEEGGGGASPAAAALQLRTGGVDAGTTSPAAALVSQRRPAAVAALSLLAAESRGGGGVVVTSAKSDGSSSVPFSGLRSPILSSALSGKSSATPSSTDATGRPTPIGCSTDASAGKPATADGMPVGQPEVVKRKRGRPLGSKNKKKDGLSYKPTKKDRAKPATTSKRSAAAVAAAAIASLEGTGRAGRTAAGPASHATAAGQQASKSVIVAVVGPAAVGCSKLDRCLVGGVKVDATAAASQFTAATRTAISDAAFDRPEVRVASFTKVGRVKEMSPRGQQQQQHLTAAPLTVSARSLAAADDSPWLCVFCHEVSNYKSLGDLFGPYRFVGASPCSPLSALSGSSNQPLRTPSAVTPAAADTIEPKRGRPLSATRALSSATAAAAARRSAGGVSPPATASLAGGEWRPLEGSAGSGRFRTAWYHEDCAVWAPGVNLVGQQLVGLDEAILVGEQSFCTRCKRNGALLGCYCKGCSNKYHYYCAIEDGCTLSEENYSTVCPRHSSRGLTASNEGVAQAAGATPKTAAAAEASRPASEMSGTPKKKPRY